MIFMLLPKNMKQFFNNNTDWRKLVMRGIIIVSASVMLSDTLALMTGIDQFKYIDELLLVLLAALALFFIVIRKKIVVKPLVLLATVGLGLFGLASSIQQHIPLSTVYSGGLLMLKPFLFLLTLVNLPWKEEDLHFLFKFYNIVMLVILGVGVVDFLLPSLVRTIIPPMEVSVRGGLNSIKSIFINQGIYSIFTAFYALYFWVKFWQTRKLWYLGLFALVFILGPFLSLRRKSVVAIAVIVGLFTLWDLVRLRIRKAMFVVLIGAIVFVTVIAQSVIMSWFERLSFDFLEHPERNARLALTVTSFEIAKDYFPLGAGWGQFGGQISRVEYSPLYYKYELYQIRGLEPADTSFVTDTFWPWVLGETGIFGLASYVLGVAAIGFALWRRYLRKDHLLVYYLFGLVILIETLGESVAQQIYGHFTAFYVFGLMAVLLAMPAVKPPKRVSQ